MSHWQRKQARELRIEYRLAQYSAENDETEGGRLAAPIECSV